ncbi:hypothetical protein ACHAWF_016767 [Thalassiosira exigua]
MATSSRASSPTNAAPAAAPSAKGNGGKANPTGFVLKLYNMVNGAPDDIISWVPSGEAFRVSDLARLESETLPHFFRHSRFQSLVRQLNFYNFRKINRERTFWVYHHPLFHRDRPQDMHRLRRRTCPGYDGRKNQGQDKDKAQPSNGRGKGSSAPSPSANVAWSNNDQAGEENHAKGQGEAGVGASSPPGIKVSRSPSPSYSPMDHQAVGQGSVHPSGALAGAFSGSSLKSVVSEEERSPFGVKQPNLNSSFTSYSMHNDIVYPNFVRSTPPWKRETTVPTKDGTHDFYRTVSGAGEETKSDIDLTLPTEPIQSEDNVFDQLKCLSALSGRGFAKKSRKAKLTPSNLSEDDASIHSYSSTRKKFSREELRERQDHVRVVADVSRRLNAICSDYAESIYTSSRPRGGRGKSRSRLAAGGVGQAVGQASAAPVVFGLDKPSNHYFGIGKCDLFTYDCDDGFVVDDHREDWTRCDDEDDEGEAAATAKEGPKALPEPPAAPTPPSKCPVTNHSLVRACMEGQLIHGTAVECTLTATVLSLCLSAHPRDADLGSKLSAHLAKWPVLAREFGSYCQAMAPGIHEGDARKIAFRDLGWGWKAFSVNFLKRISLACREREQLTAVEKETVDRCFACWSEEI